MPEFSVSRLYTSNRCMAKERWWEQLVLVWGEVREFPVRADAEWLAGNPNSTIRSNRIGAWNRITLRQFVKNEAVARHISNGEIFLLFSDGWVACLSPTFARIYVAVNINRP